MNYKGKITRINCEHQDIQTILLPLVIGKVFHVTSSNGFEGIDKDRKIKHNKNGDLEYSLPTSDASFCRRKGWISLVDLREISADFQSNDPNLCIELGLNLYLRHPKYEKKSFFLILSSALYPRIINSKEVCRENCLDNEEGKGGGQFSPKVESCFPGNIPIEGIDEVLEVTKTPINQGISDVILDAIRKAREEGLL